MRREGAFSVAVIAAIFLCLSSCTRGKPDIGAAPTKFIPAQTLHFFDANQIEFATLKIGADSAPDLEAWDFGGLPSRLLEFTELTPPDQGHSQITVHAPTTDEKTFSDNAFAEVRMDVTSCCIEMSTTAPHDKESKFSFARTRKPDDSTWWRTLFHSAPNAALRKWVPSEDLRLVDRDGRVFAIAGLGAEGNPTIAFINQEGVLVAALSFKRFEVYTDDKRARSIALSVYDDAGNVKASVDMSAQFAPLITWAQDDLHSFRLTGDGSQAIPMWMPIDNTVGWLRRRPYKLELPIVLLDERGQVVWQPPMTLE